MDENELKRQALQKLFDAQKPDFSKTLGDKMIELTGGPGKGLAESIGISGAGASQLGLGPAFVPENSKYSGKQGFSERKEGINLSADQPALNRVGGPLDISPAGVVGEGIDAIRDPVTLTPPSRIAGLGVRNIAKYPSLSGMMKNSRPQAKFIEEQMLNDPKVRDVLLERRTMESGGASKAEAVDRAAEEIEKQRLREEALQRGADKELTKK